MPQVLEPILAKRARLKRLKQTATDAQARQTYDRRQTALKWILVTSFGYLGYKNFVFGRIEAHEAVTAYSRELLLQAKELAEAAGFRLIHAIVDSIWVHKPHVGEREVAGLADTISRAIGIPLAVEGVYRWLIFPPSRTHPRLGVPKVRGLECRRHDTAPFIAQAQQAVLQILTQARTPPELARHLPEALDVLKTSARQLWEGRVPLHDLAITKQVSQDPDAYRRPCDTAIAAHSLLARGVRLAPGESVQFVITAAGDADPACRVRPLAWGVSPEGYDRAKYVELLLRAAETVLGPLGYDYAKLNELTELQPAAFR